MTTTSNLGQELLSPEWHVTTLPQPSPTVMDYRAIVSVREDGTANVTIWERAFLNNVAHWELYLQETVATVQICLALQAALPVVEAIESEQLVYIRLLHVPAPEAAA